MTIRRPIESMQGDMFFGIDFPVYVNRATETFHLHEHSHDFVEIAYVAEGKGFHYIGDRIVPVRKGDLFYIPVGISHVFRPADAAVKDPLIVYNCIFGLELLDRIIRSHSLLLPSEEANALIAIRNRTDWLKAEEPSADARNLMQRLYQEYAFRQEARNLMVLTYVIQLLLTLYRSIEGGPMRSYIDNDSRMDDAIRYIQQHLDAPLSLTDISAKINIGKRQFNRLIKKATGQTYTDYLHSLQIERCCEQLRNTDRKVYEIAETIGFKDMKHFHAVFKRKTGLSPREYRKQSK
ncbi:helix-turn-helix domain-containing protein [Paenibacillus mesophilus]|uniref:helix-turn-helix domain-containing protein n=1 Tax=Paenibacillus mesophilus TaxID=2582849 RepID=UPI00110EFA85|nr:helix-turn-helix domain-containing protein [Paenibacillus mesophilus]TMV52786.1 helix-turn-helix domain-containing protein [Paenibacillus mesophilus]